jgi:hypothetical protein
MAFQLSKRTAADGTSNSITTALYRPRHEDIAPWQRYKAHHTKPKEVNEAIEKATYKCCLCDNVAHYRVGLTGYCREPHRAEAYAAQAVYFAKRERKNLLKGIK